MLLDDLALALCDFMRQPCTIHMHKELFEPYPYHAQ